MSNPLPAYNDGLVPFGSIPPTSIKRGPTATATTIVTNAIFESPSFSTPSNRIHRPNSIGGPNGNVVVNTQETASGTVQLLTATTETIKNADWFQILRDGKLFQGPWSASGIYTTGMVVVDVGIYYVQITTTVGPSVTHPASDSTNWAVQPVETWVFESIGDPWETTSYRKHNWTGFLAHNPP